MMKGPDYQKFELNWLKKEKPNPMRNFRLGDALYQEAVALGVFPMKNPLEGLEIDIRIAKVVNRVSKIA
jgi:hypothetical protein